MLASTFEDVYNASKAASKISCISSLLTLTKIKVTTIVTFQKIMCLLEPAPLEPVLVRLNYLYFVISLNKTTVISFATYPATI